MQPTRELKTLKLSEIKPYPNNPRKNDNAVETVAESIKQCGYCAPIAVDEACIILAGHTRLKAIKKLGWKEAEVLVISGLTEEQKKKYRLLDNKTGEVALWDFDALKIELEGMDFEGFDFHFEDIQEILQENKTDEQNKNIEYSEKIDIPQYQITGECPAITDLYDAAKTNAMIEAINAADISEDEKEFLRLAAYRHLCFSYKDIAEYYAHASAPMQKEMERSCLIIIDYDDAIKNGYAKLKARITGIREENEDE